MSTTDSITSNTPTSILIDAENPSETLAKCAGMARLLAAIDFKQPLADDAERALNDLLNGIADAMEHAGENLGLPARALAEADWSAGSSATN